MAVMRSEVDGEHPASHYLVVEDPEKPSTWHLRVRDVDGNLDHRLMGAAWAALHEGYRGNQYEGPGKQEAISKLRALYEEEGMEVPEKMFGAMVAEEFAKMLAADPALNEAVQRMSAKYGARHSGKDQEMIQSIHDLAVGAGAHCGPEEGEAEPEDEAVGSKGRPRQGLTVKSMTNDSAVVGGYGIVFGGMDLAGDTFTPETELRLDMVPVKDLYYDHSMGEVAHAIGTVLKAEADQVGVWVESQLDRHKAYVEEVLELIKRGVLGYSSGSVPHLVHRDNGKILAWPVVEWSLTPTPAEPRTIGVERIKQLTEAYPNLKGLVPEAGATAGRAEAGDAHPGYHITGGDTMSGDITPKDYSDVLREVQEVRGQLTEMKGYLDTLKEVMPPTPSGFAVKPSTPAGQDTRKADAFKSYLRYGSNAPAEVKATLQADLDIGGGYLVPPEQFVAQLIKSVDDRVFVRQYATKITLTRAESLGAPTLDTDAADASWTTELATGSEDTSIVFGKRSLTPQPMAKLIKLSNKLIRNAAVDPVALVRDRLSYKFGITQEKAFLTGTGAGQPLGVFVASTDGISTARDYATAGATAITAADLIGCVYNLKQPYWARARWMLNRVTVGYIRALAFSTGPYIYAEELDRPNPTLMGFPVHISEYVPSTMTAGLYTGILGDFSFYWIADALDMQLQVLNELYAATNQTGYIGRLECDAMPVLGEAFSRLIQHA